MPSPIHPVTDVSHATTDELLCELFSRFDGALFVCSNPEKVGHGSFVSCRFNGSLTGALGLLKYANIRLNACAESMWGDVEYSGEDVD